MERQNISNKFEKYKLQKGTRQVKDYIAILNLLSDTCKEYYSDPEAKKFYKFTEEILRSPDTYLFNINGDPGVLNALLADVSPYFVNSIFVFLSSANINTGFENNGSISYRRESIYEKYHEFFIPVCNHLIINFYRSCKNLVENKGLKAHQETFDSISVEEFSELYKINLKKAVNEGAAHVKKKMVQEISKEPEIIDRTDSGDKIECSDKESAVISQNDDKKKKKKRELYNSTEAVFLDNAVEEAFSSDLMDAYKKDHLNLRDTDQFAFFFNVLQVDREKNIEFSIMQFREKLKKQSPGKYAELGRFISPKYDKMVQTKDKDMSHIEFMIDTFILSMSYEMVETQDTFELEAFFKNFQADEKYKRAQNAMYQKCLRMINRVGQSLVTMELIADFLEYQKSVIEEYRYTSYDFIKTLKKRPQMQLLRIAQSLDKTFQKKQGNVLNLFYNAYRVLDRKDLSYCSFVKIEALDNLDSGFTMFDMIHNTIQDWKHHGTLSQVDALADRLVKESYGLTNFPEIVRMFQFENLAIARWIFSDFGGNKTKEKEFDSMNLDGMILVYHQLNQDCKVLIKDLVALFPRDITPLEKEYFLLENGMLPNEGISVPKAEIRLYGEIADFVMKKKKENN